MRDSLQPGIEHEFKYKVPVHKTVPALLPESPEFQAMPEVLATGFLVGLVEWTCIQALKPHLDWPREQSVGTRINLSHEAPTPPGMEVTVRVRLVEVDGRRLVFEVEGEDGVDTICRGTHERFVINYERFMQRVTSKREKA